ncbi:hypothetical protein N431DRAFT_522832 [Stipitochalara longipes BDJ]|nr:hypothetical protein N431DRAFT_522832 [Stipitochalara longipes BDJ]
MKMSESNTTLISSSSTRSPTPSSSSWQSISEAPLRCFHLRLLHTTCGHVSFLECHEPTCNILHVGWILEKTPPDPPSSCLEMKHCIRIKDERCKVIQSYLDSPLTRTAGTLRGWFSMKQVAEKKANPIAIPQDVVDTIVEGWKIQIEHMKAQKLLFEEEQRERMQVCVASAEVEEQGESSGNAQETMIYVASDEEARSPDSEWLLTFE